MPLEAFGQTDVGRRRKLNEDNFLVKPDTNLYAVCDGMGGHNAGEVASKMAIETLEAFIRKSAGEEKDITWPYGLEAHLSFEERAFEWGPGLHKFLAPVATEQSERNLIERGVIKPLGFRYVGLKRETTLTGEAPRT